MKNKMVITKTEKTINQLGNLQAFTIPKKALAKIKGGNDFIITEDIMDG